MVARGPIDEHPLRPERPPRGTAPDPVPEGAPALGSGTEAGGEFLAQLAVEAKQVTDELSGGNSLLWGELNLGYALELWFLAFLRRMARFGVFSFGPISIYVPLVEEALRSKIEQGLTQPNADPAGFVRLTELMREEQLRLGGRRVDELHVLLAFMRVDSGLPSRVFGELGVSPAQVETYAREGAAGSLAPERLYSPEEAAAYLGIHVQTVRAWIRSRRLKASRLAGQRALRIRASDLETILEPLELDGSTAPSADG